MDICLLFARSCSVCTLRSRITAYLYRHTADARYPICAVGANLCYLAFEITQVCVRKLDSGLRRNDVLS